MVPVDIEALIVRACNGYLQGPDMALNLDIAELAKTKPSLAKKALIKVLRIASDEIDRHSSFLAVQLLDCLMVNCGYPIRFLMARKENLNLLVKRFPPSPSFELDHAMKRTLKLINKWKLSLCDKSRYKADFSNILLMHQLLASKSFLFPPIAAEEIDSMIGLELQTLRTKESLEEEQKLVLETKLEYHLSRGTQNDIKTANEIMKQMIELQDPSKYSQADSQIRQDLQTFTNKLNLLEELIDAEDDQSSVQTLLGNPTIGQMYNACCAELPKLIQLANSDLAEDLMAKIIAVTERMSALKVQVEGQEPGTQSTQADLSLAASNEALSSFDASKNSSGSSSKNADSSVQVKSFSSNELLCWDVLQLKCGKTILRVTNVSGHTIYDVKMNEEFLVESLQPLETYTRTIKPNQVISSCSALETCTAPTSAKLSKEIQDLLLI